MRGDGKPSFSILPRGSTGSDGAGAGSAARGSLSSHPQATGNVQTAVPRRVIVTLDYLRREYQSELDRVSRIERGDWELGFDDDEGDYQEGDDDETMVIS